MFSIFRKKVTAPEPDAAESEENEILGRRMQWARHRCQTAGYFADRLAKRGEDVAEHLGRYKEIRNECLDRIDGFDDDLVRGFITIDLIAACLKAGDSAVAKALFVSIRDEFLREKVLEQHPDLKPAIYEDMAGKA